MSCKQRKDGNDDHSICNKQSNCNEQTEEKKQSPSIIAYDFSSSNSYPPPSINSQNNHNKSVPSKSIKNEPNDIDDDAFISYDNTFDDEGELNDDDMDNNNTDEGKQYKDGNESSFKLTKTSHSLEPDGKMFCESISFGKPHGNNSSISLQCNCSICNERVKKVSYKHEHIERALLSRPVPQPQTNNYYYDLQQIHYYISQCKIQIDIKTKEIEQQIHLLRKENCDLLEDKRLTTYIIDKTIFQDRLKNLEYRRLKLQHIININMDHTTKEITENESQLFDDNDTDEDENEKFKQNFQLISWIKRFELNNKMLISRLKVYNPKMYELADFMKQNQLNEFMNVLKLNILEKKRFENMVKQYIKEKNQNNNNTDKGSDIDDVD